MKKLFMIMLCALATLGADAKKKEQADPSDNWRHRKYLNLSWVNQTLSDPALSSEGMKSNIGAALSTGKTYYLHKTPIAGFMKFGLDWTKFDINYARYLEGNIIDNISPAMTKSGDGFDDIVTDDKAFLDVLNGDWGKNQVDIAMHFGLSLTMQPVDGLRVNGYYRFAPTLSGLLSKSAGEDFEDMTYYGGYGSFWVGGGAISYKVISFGVETRWGTTKYRNFAFDSEGNEGKPSLFGEVKHPLKTNSTRIYLSFRF